MALSFSEGKMISGLQSTTCKTIRQYSSKPVPEDVMRKLQEIADDYCRVKNYVYDRYGGLSGLPKLYPGYTIQNEMTRSGLRDSMKMPSVYFYLAIFDALGDIKSQWSRTKSKVLDLIGKNESFSGAEKHYLSFVMKINNAFEAVLNQSEVKLHRDFQEKYDEIAAKVDTDRLNRYLCRQVRKYHVKLHTDRFTVFSLAERAYRYADHGIYISIKEKRKRVFIPLTDNNQYKCQIRICLYPEENRVELHVPVDVSVKKHKDYVNQIGISMGFHTMLTTDKGNRYGEALGTYQKEYTDWMRKQTSAYNQNRSNNPGRKKYFDKKRRFTEQIHGYINHELNRFLETEKPEIIYTVKLPAAQGGGKNRKINYSVAMWQKGYIRSRLVQKCKEQSVELLEVLGKDISRECSLCGRIGCRKDGVFCCSACGYEEEEKINTARNVKKRGTEGKILR